MYSLVKQILDMGKAKDVDLFVAKEMLIHENKESTKEIQEASDFIQDYYTIVTFLRRNGDEDKIKKLCELYVAGNKPAILEFIKEIEG